MLQVGRKEGKGGRVFGVKQRFYASSKDRKESVDERWGEKIVSIA